MANCRRIQHGREMHNVMRPAVSWNTILGFKGVQEATQSMAARNRGMLPPAETCRCGSSEVMGSLTSFPSHSLHRPTCNRCQWCSAEVHLYKRCVTILNQATATPQCNGESGRSKILYSGQPGRGPYWILASCS
jgi:hypothetical protein